MTTCSIVIPVYNHSDLTRNCLDALLSGPTKVRFETIVVNDASTDNTSHVLRRYGARIRVITHPKNRGFAATCNDGAAASSCEYIVFLNNDTIPTPGFLDALVRYAEPRPGVALVGCRLLYPDETIQHAGVVIGEDCNPRHVYAGFPATHPAVNTSRRFQIVTAACMLARRGPFVDAGGFDSAFRNGYEDVDLCLRLNQRGHEVHYCHEAVLYHLESASEGRFLKEKENFTLYRRRWASRVRPDDLQYYLADGLLSLSYPSSYPLDLSVSPLLARVRSQMHDAEMGRLLHARSDQVASLLKEVVRLTVLVAQNAAEGGSQTARRAPQRSPTPGKTFLGTPPDSIETSQLTLDALARLARRDDEIAGTIFNLQRQLFTPNSAPHAVTSRDDDRARQVVPGPSLAYRGLAQRIRDISPSIFPAGAVVLVISRGDGALLELEGREAWHFPQNEHGVYAGFYPADGGAAVAHLESLRALGADFLLVPSVALWWLDYYTEFRQHLEQQYRVVFSHEDFGIAFCLRPRAPLSTGKRERRVAPKPKASHRLASRRTRTGRGTR